MLCYGLCRDLLGMKNWDDDELYLYLGWHALTCPYCGYCPQSVHIPPVPQ